MSGILDLSATLQLNTSNFASGLSGAASNMKQFGSQLLEKFGVKGAVVAGVAAGFALLGKKAFDFTKDSVKVGMEFDKSMSQVYATMGDKANETVEYNGKTMSSMEALRDYAQEMGSKTAFSATESAEALNYMALAGYDAEKSMDMLPNVLNLAAAGGMELATASDMVTDASSALGLSTEETTQLVDKMAQASTQSNTSVSQLGEAMLTVGGTAKQLKGGTTELSTALGILADNGIKGSEGGTILRNTITSLTNPTSKAQGELDKLGVSVFDSEGNMRSMNDIMGDLNGSLSNLTAEERAKAMGKIFNKRDLKGIEALLAGAGDRWDELSGSIDGAQGAAQKMADTQLDNLAGDITLAQSAFEGLQIAVSDKVTPVLRNVVQFGTDMISSLSEAIRSGDLAGAVMGLFTGFLQKIAEFAPMIIPAGLTMIEKLVVGIVNALPKLLDGAAKAIEAFANGMIRSLPKIAGAALKLVVHLAKSLVKNAPRILSAAVRLASSAAKGILKGLPQMLKGGKELGRKVVVGIGDWLAKAPSKAWSYIKKIPSKIKEAVPEMLQAGIDLVKGLWEGMKQKFEELKEAWREKVGGLGAETRKQLDINSPSKVFIPIGQAIPEGMAVGVENGMKFLNGAMDEMNDVVQGGVDEIQEVDMGVSDGVFTDAITISLNEAFGQAMQNLIPEMREGMASAMDGVRLTLDKREFGRMSRKAMQGAL